MKADSKKAAAEVERLTRLRDAAETGSEEHPELNHKLMKARRKVLDIDSEVRQPVFSLLETTTPASSAPRGYEMVSSRLESRSTA